MVYQASSLLAKLRCLFLAGQDSDGNLEWIGTDNMWKNVDLEEESILRDWDIYNS